MRWDDSSRNEQGLEFSDDANFTNFQVRKFSANTTEVYITSLFGGMSYYFRVYGYNTAGRSSYSNVILATT
ncbi:MAG: fibronectin type III domain-containing protein [bacterium]|nr:fibronectin type III domain-containing protein [bacterium]MDW8088011.1 fibronectin type III domain-containing protein [Candidatus Calescibacterium sp.]